MLKRQVAAALLLLASQALMGGVTASAEGAGGAHMEDFGTIVVSVTVPGTSGGGGRAQGSAGGGGAGPTGCYTGAGAEVPCYQWGLPWRPDRECYARVKPVQPPVTDAVWAGRTEGTILECRIGTEDGWNSSWDLWVAEAALAAPPDPAMLARRAVDRMQLRAVTLGTFPQAVERAPEDLGYVGWNVWMWVDDPAPASWGPITRAVSESGYTVTATGQVHKVVWDMGDGTQITCSVGEPWRSIWVNNEPSPDCGHVYERDGEYSVSATSHWVVTWSGIGQSGTITLQLSDTATLRIAEVQVVNATAGG